MSELFRRKTYFTCTPKGRVLVEKFEQSEKELRLKAETETESALRAGGYKDACITVSSFEASQVFRVALASTGRGTMLRAMSKY
jgi:hypothetical protein